MRLTHLRDAQLLARQNPKSFKAPSLEELGRLKAGDMVKVCRYGERFWIHLQKVSEDRLDGIIANAIALEENLDIQQGRPVHCQPRHVYEILPEGSGTKH
jgi:hypothetical protein